MPRASKKNLAKTKPGIDPTVAAIVTACSDAKAIDVVALDLSNISDIAKYFVLASGRSDRQVQGIANRIMKSLEESREKPLSVEGYDEGKWIVLDVNEIIVHLFYEPIRYHYDLETLWSKASRLDLEALLTPTKSEEQPKKSKKLTSNATKKSKKVTIERTV